MQEKVRWKSDWGEDPCFRSRCKIRGAFSQFSIWLPFSSCLMIPPRNLRVAAATATAAAPRPTLAAAASVPPTLGPRSIPQILLRWAFLRGLRDLKSGCRRTQQFPSPTSMSKVNQKPEYIYINISYIYMYILEIIVLHHHHHQSCVCVEKGH